MTSTIGRALFGLVLIIIIGVGAYVVLKPSGAVAPAPAPTATLEKAPVPKSADAAQKPPNDVGASGVYDANAPKGSAEQCAACNQYQGVQKAQCITALQC
jgi:hypothetical protein